MLRLRTATLVSYLHLLFCFHYRIIFVSSSSIFLYIIASSSSSEPSPTAFFSIHYYIFPRPLYLHLFSIRLSYFFSSLSYLSYFIPYSFSHPYSILFFPQSSFVSPLTSSFLLPSPTCRILLMLPLLLESSPHTCFSHIDAVDILVKVTSISPTQLWVRDKTDITLLSDDLT